VGRSELLLVVIPATERSVRCVNVLIEDGERASKLAASMRRESRNAERRYRLYAEP